MQEENEDDCNEDGDQEWTGEDFKKRNVEDSLRSYVLTNKCRRILTDTYFGNPPRNTNGTSSSNSNFNLMPTQFTEYTVPCCDNCLKDKNPTKEFPLITDVLSEVFGTSLTVSKDPNTTQQQSEDAGDEDEDFRQIKESGVAGEVNNAEDMDEDSDGADPSNPAPPRKPGPRRAQRLADCRDFLTKWRHRCWKKNHRDHLWGPTIVLPDHLITKFASSAWVKSVEDVHREFGGWMWIDEYSGEVLKGLEAIDRKYEEARQADEAEKQRKKKEQQAEREREKMETRRKAEERREQTKKRKAEEDARKREEKDRQKRIAAQKRQRTSYDAYLDPPPQIQDLPPLPPPPPRSRPKPTKRQPPVQGWENAAAPQPGASQVPVHHAIVPPYPAPSYFAPLPMYPSLSATHYAAPSPSEIPPMRYIPYENSYPQQSAHSSPTVGSFANSHHLAPHSCELFSSPYRPLLMTG